MFDGNEVPWIHGDAPRSKSDRNIPAAGEKASEAIVVARNPYKLFV